MEINSAMETKTKKEKKGLSPGKRWLVMGICISLLAASVFTGFYGMFRRGAERLRENPIENGNTIAFLFQHSYLLYRDLYNKVNNSELDFIEMYLPATEGNQWIYQDGDWEENLYGSMEEGEEYADIDELERSISVFNQARDMVHNLQRTLEDSFSQLNLYFDYMAEDLASGEILTNLADTNLAFDNQYFVLTFEFDENGNISLGSPLKGSDTTVIRKYANEVMRSASLEKRMEHNMLPSASSLFRIEMPKNFKITYCIAANDWAEMQEEDFYIGNSVWSSTWNQYTAYRSVGSGNYFVLFLFLVFVLAIFLPGRKAADASAQEKVWSIKEYMLPLEAVFGLGIMLLSFSGPNIIELVIYVAGGGFAASLNQYMPLAAANILVYTLNILGIGILFFLAWYLGTCMRPVKSLGIRKYFKKKCLIYRFFPFIRRKIAELYETLVHFDVTSGAQKLIWKIVIINAILLFFISSLWVGGFFVAVIYSVILFFILKKYISDIQKKYSLLLGYINRIAEGNLNSSMVDDLGVFNPFKPQLVRIQQGFKKAVEEEVKSSRMKSELITNVSHDLKTPLTAIITYVNLLKDENLTEEQRKEYLDTLERKSLRLKVLIEDLFEVSKASTGNVTLNLVNVDIMNLVKQVALELSDKLQEAKLDMRMNITNEKVILPLDSQKTYRIYENLIGNIAKYAMPGTRVYINGFRIDDTVVITLKNITAQEINISPDELTERFMRGDSSRNTEGSGLGLAIAKSFTELQSGRLELDVDGDLFKVTTTWKIDTSKATLVQD